MVIAGVAFVATSWVPLLILAATIGVISPTGNEVGPFLAVEQAALSQATSDERRISVFAWYNLAGYVATAVGALSAGLATQAMIAAGFRETDAYRAILIAYAAIGLAMAAIFARVGPGVEAPPAEAASDGIRLRLGLGRSRRIVARLSALFALDAFGGGFVPQSLMAYWFHLKFNVEPAVLGGVFFGANLLAAVSSLSAARIAGRIGLINTMVFTHIPASLFLIAAAFTSSLELTLACLLARSLLSQMDVPARGAFVMSVVTPEERPAAASFTSVPRSLAAAASPSLTGVMFAAGAMAAPLVICGVLKIAYDLALFAAFRRLEPGAGRAGEP
jgi:MFS family permease